VNLQRAIVFFQQAIARDPSFARAHAELAMAYFTTPLYTSGRTDSIEALAIASARRAAALDSMQSDAQLALGRAFDVQLRFPEGLAHYRRGLALDSSSVTAYHWLGTALLNLGHTDEALVLLRRAGQLDPLARSVASATAYALFFARRFPEANAAARRGLAIDSTFVLGLNALGMAQVFGGAPDSALRNFERALHDNPNHSRLLANLVLANGAAGRWPEARRVAGMLARPGGDQSGGTFSAMAALVLGDREPLLQELTTPAGQRRFEGGGDFLGCNPILDPLWPDPRFRSAMRALGVEVCQLAAPWPGALAHPRE
jgi:serine/threonine-protein kinase